MCKGGRRTGQAAVEGYFGPRSHWPVSFMGPPAMVLDSSSLLALEQSLCSHLSCLVENVRNVY